MVAQAGQYYKSTFKGYRGVTQRDPLRPNIFNMVVDSVIRHWMMVVSGEEAEPEGFWRVVQQLAALFYAESGLIASPWSAQIQEDLYDLTGILNWVILRINTEKWRG